MEKDQSKRRMRNRQQEEGKNAKTIRLSLHNSLGILVFDCILDCKFDEEKAQFEFQIRRYFVRIMKNLTN
jgi:hypothetical protein